MVSIPVKRRTQPDGRKTKQVKRNSGRVTHRRKRGWWESGDNHIKQSKVQYLKIWVLPCHSLKMRGRDRERKKRRKERERERVPTSALTSSTSLACDHTALLSYSHWTREKKGKQWARGKWSGQSGMLCRGREGERERESKAGRGGREKRGGRRGKRWERYHLFLWRKLATWLRRMRERSKEEEGVVYEKEGGGRSPDLQATTGLIVTLVLHHYTHTYMCSHSCKRTSTHPQPLLSHLI